MALPNQKVLRVPIILLFVVSFFVLAINYSRMKIIKIGRFQRWTSSSQSKSSHVSSIQGERTSTKLVTKSNSISRRPPLIALWQHPFGRDKYGPEEGEHCGCKFTYDRALLGKSDAVALYCRDADKSNLPPDFPNRNEFQIYVWWCLEPPTHLKNWGIDLDYRRGFFNWTLTPRRDSTIRIPWGFLDDMKSVVKEDNLSLKYLLSLKKKTAIAVVSNCGWTKNSGGRARLRLIKEMKEKGLDLDAYGKCFKNVLDKKQVSQHIRGYKFHLAFENSYHCRDYISEKFWLKGIRLGTVPVVWGARKEDYLAIAPESSFIFAEDFSSVNELVKYLNYLDKNDTTYLKYLEWRSPVKLKDFIHKPREPPISSEFLTGCELCRHLLKRRDSKDKSVSIIPSVKDFYYDSNDSDCFRSARANETYWKFGGND